MRFKPLVKEIKEYLKDEVIFNKQLNAEDYPTEFGRKELAESLLEQIKKWEQQK